jgi:hypothetical protein
MGGQAQSDVDIMTTISDDWYANHNRFEERRHWLSHEIGQLQPSHLPG